MKLFLKQYSLRLSIINRDECKCFTQGNCVPWKLVAAPACIATYYSIVQL